MPRLEPIVFSEDVGGDDGSTSSMDMFSGAMLHELPTSGGTASIGRVLTYADRVNSAVVEFADEDGDDEGAADEGADDEGDVDIQDEGGAAAGDEEGGGGGGGGEDDDDVDSMSYTPEQLELLKSMPPIEPIDWRHDGTRSWIASQMPQLAPLDEEGIVVAAATTTTTSGVRFVEAQVSNLANPVSSIEDDGGDDDDDDEGDDQSQSITSSMIAQKGMGMAELMRYKLQKKQQEAAADTQAGGGKLKAESVEDLFGASVAVGSEEAASREAPAIVYSTSSDDTENFARDFARYVRLNGAALSSGAVVLAPVSSAYTETVSKGIMAMDDKTFAAFMERHIMLPRGTGGAAASTTTTAGGGVGLRFSKATHTAKFVPMRGSPKELVRDAARKIWTLDAEHKRHAIVTPHKYADYTNVYFIGNGFLIEP